MSKKSLLIILVILLVILAVVTFLFFKCTGKKCTSAIPVQKSLYKTVTVAGYTGGKITFSMPTDWNAYYNSDPVLITNLDEYNYQKSIIASVSTADSPVTLSDINWTQVDFLITDGDLITEQFIDQQKKELNQTVESIKLPDFTGYVITYKLEGNQPTKADTGGQKYYLRPNTPSPKWNLIVSKQSKGDDLFEAGVKKIIETLSLIKN